MLRVTEKPGTDPLAFEVAISDERGESRHHVTMTAEMCTRLTQGRCAPAACIEAAFRFLLDREPKEAILKRFDVSVIAHYFPEFEKELPRYLSRR